MHNKITNRVVQSLYNFAFRAALTVVEEQVDQAGVEVPIY